MKKRLLLLLPVLAFMIIFFSLTSFGLEINGPDTVEVYAGKPTAVTYTLPNGFATTEMTLSDVSPEIAVYFDMDHYYDAIPLQAHTVYIAGGKQGSYSFRLSFGDSLPVKTVSVIVRSGSGLCIDGSVYDYSTKSNVFTVYVANYSSKPITILSGTAKAVSYSYKTFNRSLYLKKQVTIKPGKTKYVRFKVTGKITWYDPNDFYIQCQCKYNKKKYNLRFCDTEYRSELNGVLIGKTDAGYAQVKINGAWKNTMLCVPWY